MRRLTKEEFIAKAIEAHGDKYDYSKVNYINNATKVCIICPIHGEFWQIPSNHFRGCECPLCDKQNSKKLVCGVGINDLYGSNLSKTDCYFTWKSMLERCYGSNKTQRNRSYEDCDVCDEWLLFSNFKEWYDETAPEKIKEYHLDKDLFSAKYNKIYSPKTCCFLPKEINILLVRNKKRRGNLPIGVSIDKRTNSFRCCLSINGKTFCRYAKDKTEAFNVYKEIKEKHIKEIACKYFLKHKITEKVYKALINYKIEITD